MQTEDIGCIACCNIQGEEYRENCQLKYHSIKIIIGSILFCNTDTEDGWNTHIMHTIPRTLSQTTNDTPGSAQRIICLELSALNHLRWDFLDQDNLPLCTSSSQILQLSKGLSVSVYPYWRSWASGNRDRQKVLLRQTARAIPIYLQKTLLAPRIITKTGLNKK